MKALRFITILFASITLAPLMAHLLELPNKIRLTRDTYLTVQSIYSGWNLLGLFEIGTVIFSAVLLILALKNKRHAFLFLSAFVCFALALVLFFIFTFPANQITKSWTELPQSHWMQLRAEWEYSHAIRALLYINGLILLLSARVNKKQNGVVIK